MDAFLTSINAILWHDYVLYIMVITGVSFTIWSGFSQYRALTHGVSVIRGRYDDEHDPGAINHFQALATALSATVGLGNIGAGRDCYFLRRAWSSVFGSGLLAFSAWPPNSRK